MMGTIAGIQAGRPGAWLFGEHDGHNRWYSRVGFNHTLYAPNPAFMVVVDNATVGGTVPLNAKFLENVEIGVGHKGKLHDAVRLEANFKWNKLHLGHPNIHNIEYAHMPMDMAMEMGMDTMDTEMMPRYGDVMNNIGAVTGIFVDWNRAKDSSYNEIFYLGTTLAVFKSSVHGLDDDWTFANQVKFGAITTLTKTLDLEYGVSVTRQNGSHGIMKPFIRAQAEVSVMHWYGGR